VAERAAMVSASGSLVRLAGKCVDARSDVDADAYG